MRGAGEDEGVAAQIGVVLHPCSHGWAVSDQWGACADTHQPVPAATGEVMQCVYNSLTQDYRRAVETLQSLTGKTYTSLNIVGGGSQDGYLNQQTANATGLTVFAGPTEGTALGNLMVQFIHSGDFADLAEARAAIRRSFEIKEYQPE